MKINNLPGALHSRGESKVKVEVEQWSCRRALGGRCSAARGLRGCGGALQIHFRPAAGSATPVREMLSKVVAEARANGYLRDGDDGWRETAGTPGATWQGISRAVSDAASATAACSVGHPVHATSSATAATTAYAQAFDVRRAIQLHS
ncbi:unnamed protein product [Pieris brassicae]|uniref:Uncharacterized protein n=1 Tax=Pieris brassicae TaxID=7116 RepID=A0A9P0TLQ8_PIEBR|nr:unnamed protein product [Pieris brassicae]